jgi:hypothetical protein
MVAAVTELVFRPARAAEATTVMTEYRWQDIRPVDLPRAAALLKEGFTPLSIAEALAHEDLDRLYQARCNDSRDPLLQDDRVIRFDSYEDLRTEFHRLIEQYEGDRFAVRRTTFAYGGERIDFWNGISVLFRVTTVERH